MIDNFLSEYVTATPSNFPKSLFEVKVEKDLRLTTYKINVASITSVMLARIAKQLVEEDHQKTSFDLIIDCLGAVNRGLVSFSFYTRSDGLSHSPKVVNSRSTFKVYGVCVEGKTVIKGEPKYRTLHTAWESQVPYIYIVIDKTDIDTEQSSVQLKDEMFTIPIPETVLRALCVKERIPTESISRWPVGDYPMFARFRAPVSGNHSQLFLISLADGSAFNEYLHADGVVDCLTEKVSLAHTKIKVTLEATFVLPPEKDVELLDGLINLFFYNE